MTCLSLLGSCCAWVYICHRTPSLLNSKTERDQPRICISGIMPRNELCLFHGYYGIIIVFHDLSLYELFKVSIWVNCNDLTATSLEIMVNKGNQLSNSLNSVQWTILIFPDRYYTHIYALQKWQPRPPSWPATEVPPGSEACLARSRCHSLVPQDGASPVMFVGLQTQIIISSKQYPW